MLVLIVVGAAIGSPPPASGSLCNIRDEVDSSLTLTVDGTDAAQAVVDAGSLGGAVHGVRFEVVAAHGSTAWEQELSLVRGQSVVIVPEPPDELAVLGAVGPAMLHARLLLTGAGAPLVVASDALPVALVESRFTGIPLDQVYVTEVHEDHVLEIPAPGLVTAEWGDALVGPHDDIDDPEQP